MEYLDIQEVKEKVDTQEKWGLLVLAGIVVILVSLVVLGYQVIPAMQGHQVIQAQASLDIPASVSQVTVVAASRDIPAQAHQDTQVVEYRVTQGHKGNRVTQEYRATQAPVSQAIPAQAPLVTQALAFPAIQAPASLDIPVPASLVTLVILVLLAILALVVIRVAKELRGIRGNLDTLVRKVLVVTLAIVADYFEMTRYSYFQIKTHFTEGFKIINQNFFNFRSKVIAQRAHAEVCFLIN